MGTCDTASTIVPEMLPVSMAIGDGACTSISDGRTVASRPTVLRRECTPRGKRRSTDSSVAVGADGVEPPDGRRLRRSVGAPHRMQVWLVLVFCRAIHGCRRTKLAAATTLFADDTGRLVHAPKSELLYD